jgi:polar amino acid transport system substrate-binding protein
MKHWIITWICNAAIAGVLVVHTQSAVRADERLTDIVRAGKIRIGVFPSTQFAKDSKSGETNGLALDITRALAERMGIAEVMPVEHNNPVDVIACVKAGGCDLGFTAFDKPRLTEVDFTPPYIRRDFTYLVPAGSPIRSAADADRSGVRIVAVRGHASTAALVRVLKEAKPVFVDDFDPGIELLRSGGADAFGSVRETLMRYAPQLPDSQVLQDGYETSLVAISIQKGRSGWLAYVSEFLSEIKRSGWMRQAIDRAGLRGFEVIAEKVTN